MITRQKFIARFPEFSEVGEERFNIFFDDAVLLMGKSESRWMTFYDVAQANLIAHFISINDGQIMGDSNPTVPVSRTDVDDVQVEYAVGKSVEGMDADLKSTSYGQAYIRWRNMAFAGPRVA